MDLTPTAEQKAILEVVAQVATQYVERHREQPHVDPAVDHLVAELTELGVGDLYASRASGAHLDQALVTEALGKFALPLNLPAWWLGAVIDAGPRSVALAPAFSRPVRLADSVEGVVTDVEGAPQLRMIVERKSPRVGWGDPWVDVHVGPPHQVATPWAYLEAIYRLALASEAVGAAQRALDLTVQQVTLRHQFGAPLSVRQALRHRIVELHSELDATRLIVLEAAWHRRSGRSALPAAGSVAALARRLVPDLHRFHGALGFSAEHELHLHTGRLRSIAAELGSAEVLFGRLGRDLREEEQP